MITCYFGVPGVGKNTILTKIARKARKQRLYFRGLIGPKRYDHIYADFYLEGAEKIDFNDLSQYKMYNSLLLFGEMSLDADNREYKTFSKEKRDFIVLHRHLGNDIVYATQNYAKVDSKIRDLTDQLWYLSKSVVPFFSEFTLARRIFRTITINEFSGELILGYRFCNFLERFFTSNVKIVFRRFYYKFFNTNEEGPLETRTVFESIEWKTSSCEPKNRDKLLIKLLNKNELWLSAYRIKRNASLKYKSPHLRGATDLQHTFNKLKQKIK